MKRFVILFFSILCCVNHLIGQQYFVPVVGGLVNVKDGGTYFVIDLPGKDSVAIYNAIKKSIIKNFDDATKVFVGDEKNKYLRIYGCQPKSIGSGDYAFDFTYNIDIDIKNGRYRFYFTNIKIDRKGSDGAIVSIALKNGNNLFADNEKYLFHNDKPATVLYSHYQNLIRLIDLLSKVVDVRDSFNNPDTDKW